jgi:Predicted O-methyltransferase
VALAGLIADATVDERGWRAWDEWGVEVETAEFLHALVRLTKPELVVEAGTGRGYAAFSIATALAENGHGRLVTFEPELSFRQAATVRLAGLPVTIESGYSWGYEGDDPDLVFVDSYGEVRERDLRFWLPRESMIVVHDAHEHAHLLEGEGGFTIATPRGLWCRP